MKFSKWFSIFILIWIFVVPASARQNNTVDPLFVYLRDKADSTLVFYPTSVWGLGTPRFTILSKKRNKISFYEYVGHSALQGQTVMDFTAVQKKFRRLPRVLITEVTPKMKEYFAVYPISSEEKSTLWRSILDTDPWGIVDDRVDGEGCPIGKDGSYFRVADAGGASLALITRNAPKRLHFYAPYIYENQCPGRKGRIAINKIATLFTAQSRRQGIE